MKHLEIDCHFVREQVIQGDLLVQHVSSTDQFADILTKGVSTPLCSSNIVPILCLAPPSMRLRGGCKDINGPSAATCQKIKLLRYC
ncbi:unnamed protein product [Prunus armeniaca]